MYLAIDVGGTKTLVAALNEHGVIKEKIRFATPEDYRQFLTELKIAVAHLKNQDFKAAGIGIPVSVFDRNTGIAKNFSNLPWRNVKVAKDVRSMLHIPVVVENDAKLAGLSESMLLKDKYSKVLYLTISTGIGFSLIVNNHIDPNIGDDGGASMMVEHQGKTVSWESFASGKAIYTKYNLKASELSDKKAWDSISHNIAKGLVTLIAIAEPEIVVIGGGVGSHFKKFAKPLQKSLESYKLPLIEMPEVVGAKRAEDAVLYGCYDYAREQF